VEFLFQTEQIIQTGGISSIPFPYFLFAALVALAGFILSFIMLLDCYKRRDLKNKNIWMIVIVLGNFVGALLYYIITRKLKSPEPEEPSQPFQVPPCPYCGGTPTYIPQYRRYYCYHCRRYI